MARSILRATVDLLDQRRVGYRGLTIEAVAARAGVSKATIYRWWPNKAHLVLDAYRAKSAGDTDALAVGDLQPDLLAHLGQLAYSMAARGSARTVAELTIAAATDEAFGALYRETLLRDRRKAVRDILLAARERGQVSGTADLDVVVDVVFGAMHHRLLLTHAPIDGPFVSALTDLVVRSVSPSTHPAR